MARELINLNRSSRQVQIADRLPNLPIISIKSRTFFQTSIWTIFLPLKAIDRLREQIHDRLARLSDRHVRLMADSSHFVWTDEPEIIVRAIEQLIDLEEQ